MSAPIIFMDTETTGLSLDDDIWEFAAIRRHPDGSEERTHLFIEHDQRKCRLLPESFRADHRERFPSGCSGQVIPQRIAAHVIAEELGQREGEEKPHIVGAVPNFDTERITRLITRYTNATPGWHFHLVDVENLIVGFLASGGKILAPPWDSNELSATIGIDAGQFQRHSAMGDAEWARAIYDTVMPSAQRAGGGRP